jgi:hypothetical protein
MIQLPYLESVLPHGEDEERIARASAVFDDLYAFFERKR